MIDVEAVLAAHLRTQLASLTPRPTVVTELPRDKAWPLVRVHRFGGGNVTPTRALHLDRALVQVDVWADTVAQARSIAEACRAALETVPHQPTGGGVVSMCRTEEFRRVDDATFTPAKPRYAIRAAVLTHP